MYTIRRCKICNHPLHIHDSNDGYYIKNICKCISQIEIYKYNQENRIISPEYYSKKRLEKFFENMGYYKGDD